MFVHSIDLISYSVGAESDCLLEEFNCFKIEIEQLKKFMLKKDAAIKTAHTCLVGIEKMLLH